MAGLQLVRRLALAVLLAIVVGGAYVTAQRVDGGVRIDGILQGTAINNPLWTGIATLSVNGIGTTPTRGLVCQNATLSTASVTAQMSPQCPVWVSHTWNSTSGLDEVDTYFAESLPTTNAGATTAILRFGATINGGAVYYPLTISSDGIPGAGDVHALTRICASTDGCWQNGGIGLQAINGAGNSGQGITVYGIELGNGQQQVFTAVPTISSGFGTLPSVVASSGTWVFTINVGSGGSATSGVIGFPTATHGWQVSCEDITTHSTAVSRTAQTATSASTATIGNFTDLTGSGPWAANDVLSCTALAY